MFDEDRPHRALKKLTQIALITYHLANDEDGYFIHSLVHIQVRKRSQTSTVE